MTVESILPLQILTKVGAIIDGHFTFRSGMHGDKYVNKGALFPHTGDLAAICGQMAMLARPMRPEAIVGPAIGGILLSQGIARALNAEGEQEVLALFAEKERLGFALKRGYAELVRGKRVVIVEDIVTTGASAAEVARVIEAAGGIVIGIVVMVNRGNVTKEMIGVDRMESLLTLAMNAWPPNECPLCRSEAVMSTSYGAAARAS